MKISELDLADGIPAPASATVGAANPGPLVQNFIALISIGRPFMICSNPWSITLTICLKLHYLKANLIGEAENLLRHYQLTGANYQPSWNLLGMPIHAFKLKLLFNQPVMRNDDLKSIKLLAHMECCKKNLGINTNHWDALTVLIVPCRCTPETLQIGEQNLADQRMFQRTTT